MLTIIGIQVGLIIWKVAGVTNASWWLVLIPLWILFISFFLYCLENKIKTGYWW